MVPQLGPRKKVSVFLTDLMAKTRQGGEAAAALIPWFCDALPSKLSREDYGRNLKLFVSHMAEQGIHALDVTGDDVRLFKEAMVQATMQASTIERRLLVQFDGHFAFLRVQRFWPTTFSTMRSGRCQTRLRPFSDDVPLELGQRAEEMEDQFATGGCGVDGLLETPKSDTPAVQFSDKFYQILQRPSDTIQPPNDL